MIFGLDWIIALISQPGFAYTAIFILMFLESTIAPIPSEIILPFAGAMVAIGTLNPILAFLDGVIASLLGNSVGFWAGYLLGIKVILRYGKRLGFKMKAYRNGEIWIKKYGNLFAFISKLLPLIRSFASVICGAFKMDFKRFLLYTTAGVAIWSAALMYAGFILANNWAVIANIITNFAVYIGVAIALIILYFLRNLIRATLTKLASWFH